MTTIGFDALIYAWPPGGIATYQTGLMQGLRAAGEVTPVFAGGVTADASFAGVPGLRRSRMAQRHALFARNMARAVGLKSDIHHLTAFWRPPGLRARRMVLTVHDMIPERLGFAYAGIKGAHYGKAKLAARADAVICPGESVRRDVIELLRLPEDRVFAVPHGRPAAIAPAEGTGFEAESEGYVLIVGRRGHYKNFLGVIAALGPALAASGLMLVCTGGEPFSPEETLALAQAGLAGRATQRSLSPEELAAAYTHALCVIAPAKAEGFGFPVLEAMSFGAPVLASGIAAQREVAGEAALWCDPEMPESWAEGLQRMIADGALRDRLRAAGLARAQDFSWEKAARQTAAVYRAVL
jgi:glycosyltransferase involved in cell wall biosynthesis